VTYKVALCGLTARDERLIEIVITRAPNPKYPYQVGSIAALGEAHIAVIDVASTHGESQLAELRALNPNVVAVFLSDLGLTGESRYRLERRSLLLRINRVLDEVVESELLTNSAKVSTTQNTAAVAAPAAKSENAFIDAAVVLEHAPLQPLRALIVDDSLTVREQLRSALDRAGIVSDQADCAENAFSKLQSNNYDIVFLDVVMPGADGYEVCRTIKKNAYTRSVPVLMLTSRSSPFDRARGALAGCDSYLVKPITWETFFTAVDKVLAKHFRNDRALLSARGYRAALAG
jgi:twitching motility two-component system response regulator PilG